MRAIAMTAILVLAASGLSACNRNKVANNMTGSSNGVAPAAAPAAPVADPSTGRTDYRAAFIAQCEQQARANPNVPAALDVSGACGCAYDGAFTGTTDVLAAAQSPEGQQRFAQALAQCLQDRAGNIAPPGADAPDTAEEPGGQ